MLISLAEVKRAFVARLSEWCFAVILAAWGLVLLLPEPLYDRETWAAFRPLLAEDALGGLCLLGGLLRLAVLAANGAYRPMYHIRAWMALSSAIVWFSIAVGFFSSQQIGTWIAVYPVLFAFEIANMWRAIGDAVAAEREARQRKKSGGRD